MFASAPARNWRFDDIVYSSCCAKKMMVPDVLADVPDLVENFDEAAK